MKQTNVNTVLFNAAGLGLILFLGGYMINSALYTEKVPRCSVRYGDGLQFALQKSDGAVLSPIELQARLPSREWGLLRSSRVVSDKDAAYLQVALGTHDIEPGAETQEAREDDSNTARDGVGFVWQPQTAKAARSVCLGYRMFLSKDFNFDQRGTLPGLYAASSVADVDTPQLARGFVSRIAWDKGGAAGLNLKSPAVTGSWIPVRGFLWPTNRWVSVEQEVILNTPQKADGVIRLWLDGALKLEQTGLNLGAGEGGLASGVVSDIGYGAQAPAAGRVTVSPFVMQNQ